MSKRQRRTYSKEFKQQMVDLYNAGKPRAEIVREYELPPPQLLINGSNKPIQQDHSKKKTT